ncbi:hypothetical protein L873DRAFT_658642 [Choiromyces venosus 120613-1]|uniref:Mediator of RNA polymerase II transcription subunit 12 n=1 Tax=Choiromyces venosus 120613-1 TaxID=1336337 RepID=A0A3N4JSZ3_9PEZI|nr:hypothetical protein L873DRAFT_658642 [Choiromyces venosus 120613-1]
MSNQPSWARPPFQQLPQARPQQWINQPGQEAQNNIGRTPRQDMQNAVRHPPSAQYPSQSYHRPATERPTIIDLTEPGMNPSHYPRSTTNTPKMDPVFNIPSVVATMIETPVVVEPVKPYDGALCSRSSVQNSRTRKRLKFAPQACPPASPQFIQPSKVYQGAKNALTPPALSRGNSSSRQKQIQPQSSKSDFSKPNPRRDNKPKPYLLEPPSGALMFPGSRCSDFFPWKGNHPEDHVTDTQARNGQYDKLYVGKGNNEQASARSTLGPLLKGKTALTTLSSLLLTVLDKRQKYNRLTTPPTFKPPPRVTLPDMRREAWLRDLANPLVPLRRLSRTIPHGLKGPILLDQCAAKSIPTARAVWFARCVGANELRGLKRKGVGSFAVGSETKWLKEWTSQVVRFLERTISECGPSSELWKQKMVYAVRLSAHLFGENLLDRTLFLEWYLSYLETCSLDMLPIAYLMLSIYWDELLKTRRLGRRLAEALLGKAEAILEAEDKETYSPLMQKLSILLTEILFSHRESLIVSNSWELYQSILEACVDRRCSVVRSCLENISQRNKNLLSPMQAKQNGSASSGQRKLINMLGSIAMPYNIDEIWEKCSSLEVEEDQLVRCLCQWATTSLRVGKHRIYIVAGLLGCAKRGGINVQDHMKGFLEGFGSNVKGSKEDVYLLVSELVRSKTFSVALYMKWLISRGILSEYTITPESPCHVRLLAEVSVNSAPNHIRNLRTILLSDRGFSVEDEARSLDVSKQILSSKIPGVFYGDPRAGGSVEEFTSEELAYFGRLNRAVMYELGLWIRENVRKYVVKGAPVGRDNWRDLSVEVGITAVRTEEFVMIRQLLEMFKDFQILAEVVRMVTSSDSWATLSSAADTVSYNIEVFSSLGAVRGNLQLLYDRYKKLQMRRTLEKYVLVSLVDLASFPEAQEDIRRELETELANYDKRFPRASVAHSPVSENMGDMFEHGTADSNEEIDRLLRNGATIDKHNLSRLFETIVSRMETSFDDRESAGALSSSAAYLIKLRRFDPLVFDELMCGWVTRLLQSSSRPPLLQTLSVLVAGSCLRIDVVVQATLSVLRPQAKISNPATGEIAAQTLDILVNDGTNGLSLSPLELYSLKRKRKLFALKFVDKFVQLIRQSIQICAVASNPDTKNRLRGLILSLPVLEFLRGLATAQPDILISDIVEPLSKTGETTLLQWLRVLIDHLLDDQETGDNTDLDPEVHVAQLVQYANDFSIGLCQLKMRIIFDAENKNASSFRQGGDYTGGRENPLMKPFFQGIASTFKDRVTIWTDLVSVLNQECAYQIRGYAEELVLNSSTFPPVRLCLGPLEPSLAEGRESGETLARALLSVIEATAYSIPKQGIASIATLLVDKLNMIIQSITLQEDELEKSEHAAVPEVFWNDSLTESRCWLLLFLRMIVLHRAAFTSSKSGASDQGRLVVGLCTLLQHEFIQQDPDLFDFVFDVTGSFIDDLTEDTRLQIRRFAKAKRPTPRMTYLISGGEAPAASILKATQRGKLVDFPIKPWERLAEPSPIIGENDTSISLTLFCTRRIRCGGC